MSQRLTLPEPLLELLRGSPLEPGTLALTDAVTDILRDNKTPFFEAYTDHGSEHVERVIATSLRLVPAVILDDKLFRAPDAAILVGAALLHDLAMHVRERGFVELVTANTRFRPLPWFDETRDGRPADMPWPELWAAFQREARRFGQSRWDLLLGPHPRGIPDIVHAEHLDPEEWRQDDRRLIGEFLRRHHARLAHEIAIHGFPGGSDLLQPLPRDIADAMGCVARSHGEPLRTGLEYLTYKYDSDMRPADALLPFLMALLRIADYLQLDADRAPRVLLHLKQPLSPKSIEEWEKHAAIGTIGWDNRDDPAAVRLHVGTDHTPRIHDALKRLVEGLQAELDTAVAILDEHYCSVDDYRTIQLSRRRFQTNLNSPALLNTLSFVPRRATLRNAQDLFRLMIQDLYGTEEPGVGGRELVANGVDAVRERRRVESHRGRLLDPSAFRDLGPDTDVLVTLDEQPDGTWLLRVCDRGIGMTPDTIVDYFLLAGASYGSSPADRDLQTSEECVATLKAGRFGIGAFAAFLLGDQMTVTTRHIDSERAVRFRARLEDELVELHRCDAPFGTEVVVPVQLSDLDWDGDHSTFLSFIAHFYRFADPVVRYQVRRQNDDGLAEIADAVVPHSLDNIDPRWRALTVDGYDAVYWTLSATQRPAFVHNGISIHSLVTGEHAADWHEARSDLEFIPFPALSIIDSHDRLQLPLHRYWATDRKVPFERELLTAIGQDIVAFGLVHGAAIHPSGLRPIINDTAAGWLPALPDLIGRYCRGTIVLVVGITSRPDDEIVTSVAHAVRHSLDGSTWTLALTSRAADAAMRELVDPPRRTVPVSFTHLATVTSRARPEPLPGIFDDDEPTIRRDLAVEATLLGALTEAAEPLLDPRVELSAYRIVANNSMPAPSPLAAPWIKLLGGPLPNDAKARAALTDRIRQEHPEMRPMIDAWHETKPV